MDFPLFMVTDRRVSTLTTVGTARSNNTTVSIPTTQAGDLIVVVAYGQNGSTANVSFSGIAGFTTIGAGATDFVCQAAAAKIADGTEGGTSLGSLFANDTFYVNGVFVFRGDVPIKSLDNSGFVSTWSNADPTSQTLLSGSGKTPMAVIGFTHGSGHSFSPASDATTGFVNGSTNVTWAYRAIGYTSAPVNHTIDTGDSGFSNGICGVYVGIR